MIDVLRTDDPALLSLATSVLTDAHVEHRVADAQLWVAGEQLDAALSLLTDAGVLD